MLIKAAQHIFTNVEKEDSPRKERGFQTLYYSMEYLTEDEKMILEEHAYFWATPKNQFYMLGEKAVVANVISLKGSDKYGGEGLYISHGLILEPAEFIKIQNNPMLLFHYSYELFCKSIDSALARGDFDTGNIDPVDINIPEDALQKFGKTTASRLYFWKQEEVRKLAALSVRAGEMTEERKSLAVVGEQKDIEDVLRYIFFLLPPDLSLNCSYDTNYYNPRIRLPYSWCGGFYEDQTPRSDAFVIIENGIISTEESILPESPYLNWLLECIDKRDYKTVQENKALIYGLEKSLGDSELFREKVKDISPDLLSEFLKCNKPVFQRKLRESLEKTLGKELGEKSVPFLMDKISGRQEEMLQMVSGDIDLRRALESVVEMLSQPPSQIPDEQMLYELKELCKKTKQSFLEAIIAFYEKDWKTLREVVMDLSHEEFNVFLKQTIGSTPPNEYFDCITTIENMDVVTDIFIETYINNSSLTEKLPGFLALIGRLTLNRQMERFEPLIKKMSPEDKLNLADKIRLMTIDFTDELLGKQNKDAQISEPAKVSDDLNTKKSGGFLGKIWPFSKKQE